MWKKFLASMAVLAILSTNAMAVSIDGGANAGQVTDYISNFVVSPEPFDPVSVDATVSFDLLQAADVYAYVMDSNWDIVATLANYENTIASQVSYTWTGRVGNSATGALLPDGQYQVKVFAVDPANNAIVLDFDYQDAHLDAQAVQGVAPQITNLAVDPINFNAVDGGTTMITFDVSEGAYLTVEVKDGSSVVKTYTTYDGNDWYTATDDHSILWDGENDSSVVVFDGTYSVAVTAVDANGLTDVETVDVEVLTGSTNNGVIEDFFVNPRTDWDPTDEELEIEFELTEDVDDLVIEARKDGEVVEIMDENNAYDGDYEEFWNGEDEDGDYVEGGVWTIYVMADGDVVSQTVEVVYVRPEITTAFVTKNEFDPSEDEFTTLVFEVDATAVVTVEVYDGSKRIVTLMDEEEVRKNQYYTVRWYGIDNDGDEVDEGNDYRFKITAENPTDDDINDVETVDVDVEEDRVSNDKSNATNDYTDPVVFDEDGYNSIEVSYCIDEGAEVYLAIYDGTSTSGTPQIELLDYVAQSAGCHTVEWNGKDDSGHDLDEGVNSYKLITKIGSYKDTETGKFVVGSAGVVEDEPTPFYDSECYWYYWDLSNLNNDSELCQAIAWGTEYGIWDGYPDGTFRPNDVINRAEVLKVALQAFSVGIFPSSGTDEGFSDVDPNAWYMPYVRTAKFYGMFHGYPDGTARLDNQINRVELLKIVLEASSKFTTYDFDQALATAMYDDVDASGSDWYYDYASTSYMYELYDIDYNVNGFQYLYPGDLAERGEVALLLYRMHKAGLL
ncbi:MAG: S-layer homology domain-containing protein [Nitrospirota bacterium]